MAHKRQNKWLLQIHSTSFVLLTCYNQVGLKERVLALHPKCSMFVKGLTLLCIGE